MTNELKPVRCGCGGEPIVGHIEKTSYLPKDRWYIGCPKCDICTGLYDTETEVVTAWNRAMGMDEKCPHCGKLVFCPHCGHSLRGHDEED